MNTHGEKLTSTDAALEEYYKTDPTDSQAVEAGADAVLRAIAAEVQHMRGVNTGIIPFLLEQFHTQKRR